MLLGYGTNSIGDVDPLDAIRLGMGCAAFNCGTLLAGRLERSAVETLVSDVRVEPA
jgi:hypothetical protein